MKYRGKTWIASVVATLLLLLSFGIAQSMTEADTVAVDGPADVIEAVKASGAVQAEILRVRKLIHAKESAPEEIKVIVLGRSCGVAGCGASYLAVITVHRRGVNPQSSSVMAMVRRSPRGVLGGVSVVELKGKEE